MWNRFVSLQRVRTLNSALLGLALALGGTVSAQDTSRIDIKDGIVGKWVINETLSQNTDEQVAAAIEADGGDVPRQRLFGKKVEDRFRGGPEEQELYDRISYDDVLTISFNPPEIVFEYADQYQRIFYTDGRRRTTGASEFYQGGGGDFSFANWEDNTLLVEARPRDGGFTVESYTLSEDGNQLNIEMTIQPDSFRTPISLRRVFDRVVEQ